MGQKFGKDALRAEKYLNARSRIIGAGHKTEIEKLANLKRSKPEIFTRHKIDSEDNIALVDRMRNLTVKDITIPSLKLDEIRKAELGNSFEVAEKPGSKTSKKRSKPLVPDTADKLANVVQTKEYYDTVHNYADLMGPKKGVPDGLLSLKRFAELLIDFQGDTKTWTPTTLSKKYTISEHEALCLISYYRNFRSVGVDYLRGSVQADPKDANQMDVQGLGTTQVRDQLVTERPTTIKERIRQLEHSDKTA